MARHRRPEAPRSSGEAPDWIWGFPLNQWMTAQDGLGVPVDLSEFCRERGAWRERQQAWLLEHGKVVMGMRSLSWTEYRRILRDEPHRVLVRPRGRS